MVEELEIDFTRKSLPSKLSLLNNSTSNSSLSSFLTHQTTNPTSTSSTNLNNFVNANHDKLVKKLTLQYKKLAADVSKFTNKSGIQKTNFLRLSLLNFLRTKSDQDKDLFGQLVNKDKLAYYAAKAFLKWWEAIFVALTDTKKPIAASQKSVYYECISRLMTRFEWTFAEVSNGINRSGSTCPNSPISEASFQKSPGKSALNFAADASSPDTPSLSASTTATNSPSFNSPKNLRSSSSTVSLNKRGSTSNFNDDNSSPSGEKEQYKNLLTRTLDYAINQLNNKTTTLSMSAFVGKIFAVCFFQLPGVANALLFLLSVRVSSVISNYGTLCKKHEDLIRSACDANRNKFPVHVRYLCNYDQIVSTIKSPKHRKFNLNAIEPPRAPVEGINDPQGVWVKKWLNHNSEVFNSFLRHYLAFASDFLVSGEQLSFNHKFDSSDSSVNRFNAFITVPGYTVISAHIYDIFNSTVHELNKRNSAKRQSHNQWNSNLNLAGGSSHCNITLNFFSLGSSKNNVPLAAVSKVFGTVRDCLYNPRSVNERLMAPHMISAIDSILVGVAKKTNAYDASSGTILDLAQEMFHQLCWYPLNFEDLQGHICSVEKFHIFIDWEFWISAVKRLLESENLNCQLKALAFLFNVWDFIPSQFGYHDVKLELIKYLVSKENWHSLFCHWSPFVRLYYNRLLVWRVLSQKLNYYQILSMEDQQKMQGSELYFQVGSNTNANATVTSNSGNINFQDKIKSMVSARLNYSYEKVILISKFASLGFFNMPNMDGSYPIVNKKFKLTSLSFRNTEILDPEFSVARDSTIPFVTSVSSQNTLGVRKISPFEILDEAVYNTSNAGANANTHEELDDTVENNGIPDVQPSVNNLGSYAKLEDSGKILGFALKLFKKSKSSDLLSKRNSFHGSSSSNSSSSSSSSNNSGSNNNSASTSSSDLNSLINGKSSSASNLKSLSSTSLGRKRFSLKSRQAVEPQPQSDEADNGLEIEIQKPTRKSSVKTCSGNKKANSVSSTNISLLGASSNIGVGSSTVSKLDLPFPPELSAPAPEVRRQIFTFQLVTEDKLTRLQSHVLANSPYNPFHSPAFYSGFHVGNKFPRYPELPFSELFMAEDYEEEEAEDELQELIDFEQKYANELVQKWGSVGKALNDWNEVVNEYETFIRLRKAQLMDSQKLDIYSSSTMEQVAWNFVPLLTADTPAPKVNAL